MSKLLNLQSKVTQKKKRVGRGNGSGHGTFSCRGMKGQKARSGGTRRPGFEGGQTPYLRKMPKYRGFNNPNQVIYQVVNLSQLEVFEDGSKIDRELLLKKRLITKKHMPVKLLAGKGEITKSFEITVDKASQTAVEKVESKKGKVVLLAAVKKEA